MAGAEPTLGLMARRVSARRVLAVVAALLALPWPVLAIGYAISDEEWAWAAICVAAIAAIVAAPLAAGFPRFGRVAAGLWFLLLALGFITALAGGFIMWPAAFVFLVAAIPARETTWRLRRVLAVTGGVVAATAAGVFAALLIGDAQDDPDLELRLRTWRSAPAVTERLLSEPHVGSVGSSPVSDEISAELEEGLTPDMRDRLVAELRRDPRVRAVRLVDEGLWP